MNRVPSSLIDELASDLAPVQPLRLWQGVALVAFAAVATVLLVELLDGLWHGAFTGQASPEFFITNGMLALLGAAASFAVVKMASPRVGNSHEGARWSAHDPWDDIYWRSDGMLASPALARACAGAVPELHREGLSLEAARHAGLHLPQVGHHRPHASDHAALVIDLPLG